MLRTWSSNMKIMELLKAIPFIGHSFYMAH